jgi:two-component system, cell cycle sensor histidine kinase and response regulator CckA
VSQPPNLSSLIESLGAIVWEADPDTFQFLFVSAHAEMILGYPVRQWIDEPDFWRAHTHPDDVQWCSEFCMDSVRNGRDHQFEYRMIAADGQVVWLRDVVTVERSATGETRMRGFMTDITDRKAAEAARRASEQQLQLAFEVASMGVAEHDHALNRTTFSDNLVRLLGFEPGTVDATYQWLLTRIHPDDRAQAEHAYAALVTSEPVGDLHYRIVRPDGGIRWLLVRNRLFTNDGGQPVRTVGVAMDVTERKELEDQVRQMQKMEALGQLASGVAHDFNNLLTVIEGYGQMLHDEWAGHEQGRLDLAQILRALDRAKLLTNQLLAFSRKQVVRPTRVDLNATVRDLSRMLARVMGENIVLDLQLDAVPPVIADVGQIEQLVMNLAVNARDAMPFGGRFTISTARATMDASAAAARGLDPGEYAALVVSDTGSGMTADVRHRIFEPFFTTKEVGKGTGLGLSTVYGIVKRSSGHIEVSSEPGRGTTFHIHFPRGVGKLAEPAPEPRGRTRGEETVLLVEDDQMVLDLASRVLGGHGYRILIASNATEALEVARERAGKIDLLLTDVVMPGLPGPELAAKLEMVTPGLRVLYMSGYADDSVARLGAEEGISFLAKPFSGDALSMRVREVLDQPRRR